MEWSINGPKNSHPVIGHSRGQGSGGYTAGAGWDAHGPCNFFSGAALPSRKDTQKTVRPRGGVSGLTAHGSRLRPPVPARLSACPPVRLSACPPVRRSPAHPLTRSPAHPVIRCGPVPVALASGGHGKQEDGGAPWASLRGGRGTPASFPCNAPLHGWECRHRLRAAEGGAMARL